MLKGLKGRITSIFMITLMISQIIPINSLSANVTAENSDYVVEIYETTSDNGFIHPGIGLTKEILENVRTQVQAKQEPWYSYYKEMLASSCASKTATISNQSSSDSTKPAVTSFTSSSTNNKMGNDGKIAYTQAILYVITGDVQYREKVMTILRLWEQMDPTQYTYYSDALIHTGHSTNRMATAAEIMRYTSAPQGYENLEWTKEDTDKLTTNLFRPIVDTFQYSNNGFMNQNNFSILGSMAALIFMDDREGYDNRIEWFTVNKEAVNQYASGSIKQLYRLVDTNAETGQTLKKPVVQITEMGRDQPHSYDDIITASTISRMMMAQKTKVDPETGERSEKSNAVGPYEFLNDRILAATNYLYQYNLGYDTPWIPMEYSVSHNTDAEPKAIYYELSETARGRFLTAYGWDLYYYYQYSRGENVKKKAPYFYEAFTKRLPMISYWWQGGYYNAWDSYLGAGDSFWLYIPAQAAAEGDTYVPKTQATDISDSASYKVEIEQRYTALDMEDGAKKNRSSTKEDSDGTSYISVNAVKKGSRLVLLNMSYPERDKNDNILRIGLKVRTNGTSTLELSKEKESVPYHTLYLPDTQGEWRYITYDMGIDTVSFGEVTDNYGLVYMKISGEKGTVVDMDHLNIKADTDLTPPLFDSGYDDVNAVAYVDGAVTLSFSATDTGETDTVIYSGSDLPKGGEIDSSTGQFSWTPSKKGTYSFIVEATDGTTVSTKKVEIVVKGKRKAAIAAAMKAYNPDIDYVSASLEAYKKAYNDAENEINSENAIFYPKLNALKIATDSLKPLTPLLADNSMDYTKLVEYSNFGNYISLLTDNNNNTYPISSLAEDSGFMFDFGEDYTISATAFALQGRMNFVDRTAGAVVYGSNDKVNWTLLTESETEFVRGLSEIEVKEELTDKQFRFIKVKKIDPQPDVLGGNTSATFEASEFRIYGERHETNNKLEAVSISSDQQKDGRIKTDDTAKLTIKATEEIQNVVVKIQGVEAAVTTTDNISFVASAVMGKDVEPGYLSFTVDYQRSDGSQANTVYSTKDGSELVLVHPSKEINVNLLGKVTASAEQWGGNGLSKEEIGYLLFDGSVSTYGDLATDSGSYYTIDFGEGSGLIPDLVALWPRTGYSSRLNGVIVQGSNDNSNWTDLSDKLTGAVNSAWNYISTSKTDTKYQYIRLYNASSWAGNIAEVEIYGDITLSQTAVEKIAAKITGISDTEEGASSITFPDVPDGFTIALKSADPKGIIDTDGTITQPEEDTVVSLVFTVTYEESNASADTLEVKTTIIGSKSAESKIDVIHTAVGLAASSPQWAKVEGSGLSAEEIAKYVFDGDTNTYGDLQDSDSYYTIDFGEGKSVRLNRVKLLPRYAKAGRMDGMVIKGSNDEVEWTAITPAVLGSANNVWMDIKMHNIDQTPYRYLRLINSGWYGNITEVELYGEVLGANSQSEESDSSEKNSKESIEESTQSQEEIEVDLTTDDTTRITDVKNEGE